MDFKGAKKYIIERLDAELPSELHYHGVHHTMDVYEVSIKIAELEQLSQEEKIIINTAALYHDAGFVFKYENNEVLAVKLINEVLPKFGYNEKSIKTIGDIILTTRIDAIPVTLLEKIMCDADYDYLGRTDVQKIADSLYKELQEFGYDFSLKEWNEIQINFLNKHDYYTNSSIMLRRDNKLKFIESIKKQL